MDSKSALNSELPVGDNDGYSEQLKRDTHIAIIAKRSGNKEQIKLYIEKEIEEINALERLEKLPIERSRQMYAYKLEQLNLVIDKLSYDDAIRELYNLENCILAELPGNYFYTFGDTVSAVFIRLNEFYKNV